MENLLSSQLEGQQQLQLAMEAVVVSAHRDATGRWVVNLRSRRLASTWDGGDHQSYELLSTDELLDVVCSWLERTL